MSYITPHEVFQGYAHAIIVSVYTDAITATAVKKEKDSAVFVSAVRESMGSTGGDMVPVDNIMFNMEKAIMALPSEARVAGTTVIVAIGPGVGVCEYVAVAGKREARERKITREEVDAMIASGNTEKGNDRVFKNYPEHFSIDGFSVSDPVGVNGGEVSVGTVRAACATAFEEECNTKLAALGFRYGGMIDMRYAAMHAGYFYERSSSALLLFVFEHETQIVIAREKAVHAIGTARGGYGILYTDIAEVFSVGIEEAKEIVRAYRKKELNENTRATVEQTIDAAAKKVLDGVHQAITNIDSVNIIPGNVHVVSAYPVPEIAMQFTEGGWFSALPIERNASVTPYPEGSLKGFETPFDSMSVDFLLRHLT